MTDRAKVLEVLREAVGLVAANWGNANPNVEDVCGSVCASVGICAVVDAYSEVGIAAHVAVLRGAGADVHEGVDIYRAVYAFNDAQTTAFPVIGAFARAIAMLEAELEPTPHADSALEVMAACDRAGAVVGRYIASEHPEMDVREMSALASGEFFLAAQDVAAKAGAGVAS